MTTGILCVLWTWQALGTASLTSTREWFELKGIFLLW
jgi:hypothetical protein